MRRLTKTQAAYKKIEKMFDSGELTGNETPKDVWEGDECFKEWPLSVFRGALNRIKTAKGVNARPSGEDAQPVAVADAIASSGVGAPATCNTKFMKPSAIVSAILTKKPLSIGHIPDCPDSGPGLLSGLFGTTPFDKTPMAVAEEVKQSSEHLLWVPYYLSGHVKNNRAIRPNFFVMTQLPSGVDHGNVKPKILDGGFKFSLVSPINPALTDPTIISHAVDNIGGNDMKVKVEDSIEDVIRELCGGARKQLWQEFTLDLPFKCEFDFVVSQPIDYYGTVFLYIQMQAKDTDEWNVKNKVNKIRRFGAKDDKDDKDDSPKKMKAV